MGNMSVLSIVALALVAPVTYAHAQQAPLRPVTFDGCVQATADPSVFQLAVPARFPDPDRGIPAGEPVPPVSGVGPEPRPDPLSAPPRFPPDEPVRPPGRYETKTMVHRTYELRDVEPATLKPLIGAQVEVTGEIRVEGFPAGDLGSAASKDRPSVPVLHVTRISKTNDTCSPESVR